MLPVLNGVVMELSDCALPLLQSMHQKRLWIKHLVQLFSDHRDFFQEVIATASLEEAFKDIDVAVLVGAMPRREGMERKDLLKANVKIFQEQGSALDKHAKKTVKVQPV